MIDPKKYYATMPDDQLIRILDKELVAEEDKIAIRDLLHERLETRDSDEELRLFLERELNRKKKRKPARMFRGRTKLTRKKGRLLQGGKVSPR